MSQKFIKLGPSKAERIQEEINKLEQEIEELGSAVSDSQIWHKKLRIEVLRKKLSQPDATAEGLNAGRENLQGQMESQGGKNQQQSQALEPTLDQVMAMNRGRA